MRTSGRLHDFLDQFRTAALLLKLPLDVNTSDVSAAYNFIGRDKTCRVYRLRCSPYVKAGGLCSAQLSVVNRGFCLCTVHRAAHILEEE